MESYERAPRFDVQASLERVPGVSNVRRDERSSDYFAWIEQNLSPATQEVVHENYDAVNVHRYSYLSDGLTIDGFIWTPKELSTPLPLVVWNRGGTQDFGSTASNGTRPFIGTAPEMAKRGHVVIGSEYRGAGGHEGKDEYGGADLNDVVRVKEIGEQLPMVKHQEKVMVVGESRGGLMSYLLAAREPWVKGIVTLGSVSDVSAWLPERDDMAKIFQEAFGGTVEEMQKRSAVHFYQDIPKDLPILLMHGSKDEAVSVEHSRKLFELLRESGHTVEYHEFPDGKHTFYWPDSPYKDAAITAIEQFFKKHE
ncbi:MAG: alpha/beta hydrolase family protein [Bacillota bacterium]